MFQLLWGSLFLTWLCAIGLTDAWMHPSAAYGRPRLDQFRLMAEDKKGSGRNLLTTTKAEKQQKDKKQSILGGERKVFKTGPSDEEEEPSFPLQAILSRTLDTAEDALIHIRRIPYDLGWFLEPPPDEDKRRTVVILGSGWAAHAFLKVADTFKLRIVCISPVNHFVFTPMLASASVGTVEYRSMTEAIRAANPMIMNYIEGEAIDVDIDKKVVKVQLESLLDGVREGSAPVQEIPYDELVVSVGCKVADEIVPGAKEYCLRLKSCNDARQLRDAVGECLEYGSRPDVCDRYDLADSERELRREERRKRLTFTIVGGGPTGVELAGELSDFFKDITRPRVGAYPNLRDDIRIVLIHGGSELVEQFDPDLRKHAVASLKKMGVEVRLNARAKEVGNGFIKFYDNKTPDNVETLDCGVTVWAAGTTSVPFIKKLLEKLPEEAAAEDGKVNVDTFLRCPTKEDEDFGSVFVLGDAANFIDQKTGKPLPQTAQVAGQQGAYMARLLCRDFDLNAKPAPKLASADSIMDVWRGTIDGKIEDVSANLEHPGTKSQDKSPGAEPKKEVKPSGWDNVFLSPMETWKCASCLVINKLEDTHCFACKKGRGDPTAATSKASSSGSSSVKGDLSSMKVNTATPSGFTFTMNKKAPFSSDGFKFNPAGTSKKPFAFGSASGDVGSARRNTFGSAAGTSSASVPDKDGSLPQEGMEKSDTDGVENSNSINEGSS